MPLLTAMSGLEGSRHGGKRGRKQRKDSKKRNGTDGKNYLWNKFQRPSSRTIPKQS